MGWVIIWSERTENPAGGWVRAVLRWGRSLTGPLLIPLPGKGEENDRL